MGMLFGACGPWVPPSIKAAFLALMLWSGYTPWGSLTLRDDGARKAAYVELVHEYVVTGETGEQALLDVKRLHDCFATWNRRSPNWPAEVRWHQWKAVAAALAFAIAVGFFFRGLITRRR